MVSQPPGITFLFLKRCTNRSLARKKAKPYGQDTELDLQDPSPFPRPGSPDHRSHLPLMPMTVGPSWKVSGPASPPWVCCVMSPPGQMGCVGEVQPPRRNQGWIVLQLSAPQQMLHAMGHSQRASPRFASVHCPGPGCAPISSLGSQPQEAGTQWGARAAPSR